MLSPKRKSPPAGYEINPRTGRIRKSCPPGKIRGPRGTYCVFPRKSKSPKKKRSPGPGYEVNPATGRIRRACPPGKVRSPAGYCVRIRKVKSPKKKKSPGPGYEVNPATGRIRKACPPGKVRSPAGYCVRSSKRKSKSPRRKSKSPSQRKKKSIVYRHEDCCVCLEDNDHFTRNCNHPLCQDCLGGMRRSGRTVKCPLCRGNINNGLKRISA